MLFRYNNKVYIKPFADKLIEVKITKKGNEYDVKPISNKKVVITAEVSEAMYSVPIETAYEMQNKNSLEKE